MKVTVVRVYLSEGEHLQQPLLKRLHDIERVRGVTVFRGISGFGESGRIRGAGLLDLSLDLPVVVEFYDAPEVIERVLAHLQDILPQGHVLRFSAELI